MLRFSSVIMPLLDALCRVCAASKGVFLRKLPDTSPVISKTYRRILRKRPGKAQREYRGRILGLKLAILISVAWLVFGFISDARADNSLTVTTNDTAFTYLNPKRVKWPNYQIQFVVNANGYSESRLVEIVESSLEKWAKRGNITYSFEGSSTRSVTGGESPPVPGKLLIQVISRDEMDALYGPYRGYAHIWWNGDIIGAEMALLEGSVCEGIVMHEIGHVLNLGHSEAFSVMNNPVGCEDNVLRRDDIEAIASMYPLKTNYEGVIGGSCGENKYIVYAPRVRYMGLDVQLEACVSTDDITMVVEN